MTGPDYDECELCNGTAEVSISSDGTYQNRDNYGCPLCMSAEFEEERSEMVARLTAKDAEIATLREQIGGLEQNRDSSCCQEDGNSCGPFDAMEKERNEALEDAERWRALMSSQRLHFMGSAGFDFVRDDPESRKTADIKEVVCRAPGLHFGMEFWDVHSAYKDPQFPDEFERKLMIAYVDELRRRSSTSRDR